MNGAGGGRYRSRKPMPQDQDSNSISGANGAAEPRPSLREVAEAAYDSIENDTTPEQEAAPEGDRARDERGRFVAKDATETGEAEPEAPSPEPPSETQEKKDEPAPEGSSTHPTDHWSAED